MQNLPVNYAEILEKRRFSDKTIITEDRLYFTIQDNIIGTSGNFISISGLQKAGKSTFISAIISSAITGRAVWDFKINAYKDKFRVCLFDTEQSNGDFNRSITRIQKLTNYDKAGIFQFFDSFLCREDSPDEILKLIEYYITQTPELSVLIIDGILGIVNSMNDEIESNRIIRTLKRWASQHNILIISVLHLGKKDQLSLGHIGSASDRYSQSTLIIEKSKTGSFICSPKYLRSAKDFEPIEIMYNEQLKKYIKI